MCGGESLPNLSFNSFGRRASQFDYTGSAFVVDRENRSLNLSTRRRKNYRNPFTLLHKQFPPILWQRTSQNRSIAGYCAEEKAIDGTSYAPGQCSETPQKVLSPPGIPVRPGCVVAPPKELTSPPGFPVRPGCVVACVVPYDCESDGKIISKEKPVSTSPSDTQDAACANTTPILVFIKKRSRGRTATLKNHGFWLSSIKTVMHQIQISAQAAMHQRRINIKTAMAQRRK